MQQKISAKIVKSSLVVNLEYVASRTAGLRATRLFDLRGNATYNSVHPNDCRLAGRIKLAISNCSLRTKESPPNVKKVFKNEVFPVLAEFLQDFDLGQKVDLTLHFHLGELTNIDLTQ